MIEERLSLLQRMSPLLALRDILQRRAILIASGAKRKLMRSRRRQRATLLTQNSRSSICQTNAILARISRKPDHEVRQGTLQMPTSHQPHFDEAPAVAQEMIGR